MGRRVTGPWPFLETSKRAIRQSVPARKVPGADGDHRREEGVRYASVVGQMRLYVLVGLAAVGERTLVSRMGRECGVER